MYRFVHGAAFFVTGSVSLFARVDHYTVYLQVNFQAFEGIPRFAHILVGARDDTVAFAP